jgi:hypothetical protein
MKEVVGYGRNGKQKFCLSKRIDIVHCREQKINNLGNKKKI